MGASSGPASTLPMPTSLPALRFRAAAREVSAYENCAFYGLSAALGTVAMPVSSAMTCSADAMGRTRRGCHWNKIVVPDPAGSPAQRPPTVRLHGLPGEGKAIHETVARYVNTTWSEGGITDSPRS